MVDELVKIKDIDSQAKKRLKPTQLVAKHGTDKQAFLLAYELRKILSETEKSITELSMTNKTNLKVFHLFLLLDNGQLILLLF
jgi:hypothetical protein